VLSEDERREIDTVGGLIFSLLGRIPNAARCAPSSGVEFEILDVDPAASVAARAAAGRLAVRRLTVALLQ